jgi:hypothetical protein
VTSIGSTGSRQTERRTELVEAARLTEADGRLRALEAQIAIGQARADERASYPLLLSFSLSPLFHFSHNEG